MTGQDFFFFFLSPRVRMFRLGCLQMLSDMGNLVFLTIIICISMRNILNDDYVSLENVERRNESEDWSPIGMYLT